jgi:hypothetical protein
MMMASHRRRRRSRGEHGARHDSAPTVRCMHADTRHQRRAASLRRDLEFGTPWHRHRQSTTSRRCTTEFLMCRGQEAKRNARAPE